MKQITDVVKEPHVCEVTKEIMIEGYKSFRAKVQELVKMRVESNPLDLYSLYYGTDPERVRLHCEKMQIDFHDDKVDIAKAKSSVGLDLIETDIKLMLTQKGKYDAELKRVGIVLKPEEIRITNGIEHCEWFEFFGSPMGHNWFSQNANKILAVCDSGDPAFIKLEKMISNIKSNWNKIAPQEPLPNIKTYNHLVNMQVHDEIKDLVSKHSDDLY